MALRKLQTEIDRTLKAVAQGVETFEATFDKLNHASNATQKDKLENDLKTQIKKLQRMRDQIKVWLGSSDIKDKSALLDNRKLIETQMERFKALEKEMKMKAFSKEGLIAAARLDPAEKARRDIIDWIVSTIDELSRQIEQTEAEAEQLQASGKKKKAMADRLSELDQLIERRQWHIGRLEIVQRMFENGQIDNEQVEMIQEDVKYFVEANTEEDFDFDLGIYDELNLQEGEEDYNADYGVHGHEDSSNIDTSSVADTAETPSKPSKEEKKATKQQSDDTPPSPVQTKRSAQKKAEKEARKEAERQEKAQKAAAAEAAAKSEAAAKAKAAAEAATSPPPAQPKAPLPPIRYAAAAAAAVGGTHPAPPSETSSTKKDKDGSSEEPTHPEPEPSPLASSSAAEPSNGHPTTTSATSATPSPVPESSINGQQAPAAESSRAPSTSYSASTSPHKEQQGQQQLGQQQQGPGQGQGQGVLENLMASFGVAKDLAERRGADPNELVSQLDVSYHNAPAQLDAEPPRYYHPHSPIQTPSYYPQTRLPQLEDKGIYQRLELDQLFYIFYYMTGTYEQWLAAQELKRQSWRFHKQYLTWFQRAHNPQAITEDYEQGGYYYFDWENSWCQRRKSDFRFEYRWLSDH